MSTRAFGFALFLALSTSLTATATGCAIEPAGEDAEGGDEAAVTARASRVEVWQSERDGKYYFHVIAGNGRILLQSQSYTAKASAIKGAESALRNINSANLVSKLSNAGSFYFTVVAENNEVVGVSQMYTRAAARDAGIAALKKVGKAITNLAANTDVAPRQGGVFEVFRGDDGQYYFHLVAQNGEIVLQSEGYISKQGAEKGMQSVQANGTERRNIDILEANDGGFYFHVKAQNGEIVGRGQAYVSASNAERGRDALVRILQKKEQFAFSDLD